MIKFQNLEMKQRFYLVICIVSIFLSLGGLLLKTSGEGLEVLAGNLFFIGAYMVALATCFISIFIKGG